MVAARFLQRRGARLVARNVRCGKGEIDLLVAFGSNLVAVEVKTRIGEEPLLAMTAQKERSFVRATLALRPQPQRMDVVAVRFERDGVWVRWLKGI